MNGFLLKQEFHREHTLEGKTKETMAIHRNLQGKHCHGFICNLRMSLERSAAAAAAVTLTLQLVSSPRAPGQSSLLIKASF